jgi:hypothetical protein
MRPSATIAVKNHMIDNRGTRPPLPAAAIVAALCVLVWSIGGACVGGGDDSKGPGPAVTRAQSQGDPRHVRIGFTSLGPERTADAYASTFAIAAQYGEVIAIPRTPPWEDFLPGGHVSETTASTTRFETALLDQYKDLQRFFAIDPTDGVLQRSRVANLPSTIDPGAGFTDPGLRQAFLSYVSYVIANYKPEYLVIGVEINMLAERSPEQFEAFLSLYKQAYTNAKAANPKMKVFPTFQYEDLLGTFGTAHLPHWELLENFRGSMDVFAVTSYPYLAGLKSAGELPPNYFQDLRTHWPGEIVIAETAQPSATVDGQPVFGTQEDQAAYLDRVLGDAEKNKFSMVIWLAARDPAFATSGPGVTFKDTGLRRNDGANKIGWAIWEEWARRPFQP